MVFAEAHIATGVKLGATLANQNVTGHGSLATEDFYAQALTFRIAAVFRTTATFFVCH